MPRSLFFDPSALIYFFFFTTFFATFFAGFFAFLVAILVTSFIGLMVPTPDPGGSIPGRSVRSIAFDAAIFSFASGFPLSRPDAAYLLPHRLDFALKLPLVLPERRELPGFSRKPAAARGFAAVEGAQPVEQRPEILKRGLVQGIRNGRALPFIPDKSCHFQNFEMLGDGGGCDADALGKMIDPEGSF